MKNIGAVVVVVWLVVFGLCLAGCASQDSGGGGQSKGKTAERGLEVEEIPESHAEVAVFPQLSGFGIDRTFSAVFSPDGKQILYTTGRLWDVASGREIRNFSEHPDWETDESIMVFSPDGKQILSSAQDGMVKLWDAVTGQKIRTFSEPFIRMGTVGRVTSLAFSPDGKEALSGSLNQARLWDVVSGREIRTFDIPGQSVWAVAFSPDGNRILGTVGKMIKLWDAATGKEIRAVEGHSGSRFDYVEYVAFSPDGKQILSMDENQIVKLWDAATGREIRAFSGPQDITSSVAFSPDGKQVLFCSGAGNIKLWDAATGREIKTLSVPDYGVVIPAFSPDGKQMLFGIYLWDIATGRNIRIFSGHSYPAGGTAAFSPDGKQIRSSAGLWDIATGRNIRTFSGSGRFMAFSPNGKQFLRVYNDNNTMTLWDAETGREIRTFSGHSRRVDAVTFSPDGKQILSGSVNEDCTMKLWDAGTGREIRTFSGHSNHVSAIAFSPDGKQVLSGSTGEVKLWDAETGREIRTFSGHPSLGIDSVAFSPDGKQIVSASSDEVNLWDTATGRKIQTFSDYGVGRDIWSVAFSPDGKQVLFSSGSTLYLMDVVTGQLRDFSGHSRGDIRSAVFSPDGKQLLSGSEDYTVKLWDAETGREIRTFLGHSSYVNSAAFSPDGKTIVSSSSDNTVRLWDAATGKEIAQFIRFTGSDTDIASVSRGLTVETESAAASIEGEWLAITPDGYYQGSPRGDRYINVRVTTGTGAKAVTTVTGIDAYRSVFYNPDVVQARLNGRPDPASKASVTIQEAASFTPPTVTIRSPASNTTTTSASTTLSVSIADQNQPVKNIKIMVNGRILGREELSAATGTSGLEPQKASYTVTGNRKTVDFQLPLSLDPGPNRIEVVAFNGFSENRRYIDVTWNAPAGQRPTLPNLWILAIGVNSYADSNIRNLNYCVADAKGVVDSLKAQEGKRYGRVNSLLIADGERLDPTAANIRQNLKFLEGAGPRDVVLLFLAGHGVSENAGAFFFLPGDARLNADKETVNPATAITGAELFSVLDAPGNRLVFIDACQSGGVDNDRLVRYLMDTNAFVFASSRGNELSQERAEFGHGVFTYSILNGIKGAPAARAAGNVSVLSMSGFVSTDVPRLTDDAQHPSAYSLGFYDFPMAAVEQVR